MSKYNKYTTNYLLCFPHLSHRALIQRLSNFLSKATYLTANGCSKSYSAVEREPPSGLRQIETKSLNSTENVSARRGGGFCVRWDYSSQKPASGMGHYPVAHSIRIMPKLHRSVSLKYWLPYSLSGDIYDIVPTHEDRQCALDSVCPLTPKSASFRTPFLLSKIFAGLISLCTICFLCK